MSDYENTVRASLSRLDSEELLEKLRKNYFTDEAKAIAEKILEERGFDSGADSKSVVEISSVEQVKSEDVAYVGYPASSIVVWMLAAFLFGISQTVRIPGATSDAPGLVMLRLTQGVFYFFLVGLIVGIYAYVKRKNVTTKEALIKRYGSNIRSILVMNAIVIVVLGLKMFFGYSGALAFLDIAIVASITIAVFKKAKSAKLILAAYAFINPLIFVFTGSGGPAGIVWSFVFLICCQAISTEKRFSEVAEKI